MTRRKSYVGLDQLGPVGRKFSQFPGGDEIMRAKNVKVSSRPKSITARVNIGKRFRCVPKITLAKVRFDDDK